MWQHYVMFYSNLHLFDKEFAIINTTQHNTTFWGETTQKHHPVQPGYNQMQWRWDISLVPS